MKRTSDPAGTAGAIIAGIGCGIFGLIAFGPVGGAIFAIIAAVGTKHQCSKATSQEMDELFEESSEEVGETWVDQHPDGKAEVSVTRWTDAPISLPQTRTYIYTRKNS